MEQMYEVVADVECYDQFVPWCVRSTVRDRHDRQLNCTLTVGFPPLDETYTSIVTLERPHYVKVRDSPSRLCGTCVEFGPTQLPVNSFRVRVRVRVRVMPRVRVRFRVRVGVRAYRKLGGPEPDTSADFSVLFCTVLCRPPYAGLSLDIRRRNNAKGPCLCHAAPPTAVGGAHNSPIANATVMSKSGLVHYRLHLYNQSGVFYFPWHRHHVEGAYGF